MANVFISTIRTRNNISLLYRSFNNCNTVFRIAPYCNYGAFKYVRPIPYPSTCIFVRYASKIDDAEKKVETKKLSLFQRFKQMYRDYWYVLVPVHLVTSAVWFGGFYYMAISGVDIVSIMENWNVSDKIVNPLRDSKMGYVAVAYALYKIATPVRYTVTLGGTTVSINYLKKWGYIKPVPSKEALKEMYKEKRENIIVSMREKKDDLKQRRNKLKGKKDLFMEDFDKSLNKFRESKNLKKKNNLIEENGNVKNTKD